MSAIAGIWHRDGRPVQRETFNQMMEPLAFRGPDRSGTWISGAIALGHHHLMMTPESVYERMPFAHASENWVITADARLDNRDDLLRALQIPSGATLPDGELILHAYRHWGEECVTHLLGDFAFAIYDVQRRRFFCARDHMGVRPFYYHATPHLFAFASGLKGLLALRAIPQQLNETRLAEMLVPNVDDVTNTCYQGMYRLPAAHTMVITNTTVTLHRYWTLDSEYELPAASDEEYAEELQRIFTRAVASRVRSAYPMGATLSGGLDSSSNTVTARAMGGSLYPGQLHTFSAAYAGERHDESDYFQSVIQQGGVVPHILECGGIKPFEHIPAAMRQYGEMFYGPNLCIQMDLYKVAQHAGIRGLLEGFDGDTTLCHGVDRLPELAQQHRWIMALRETRAIARMQNKPFGQVLLRSTLMPSIPPSMRMLWRRVRKHDMPDFWDPIIHPNLAQRTQLRERLAASRQTPLRIRVRERQAQKLLGGFFQTVLEIMNPVALTHGFHALYPYCDVRLMEFCVALPSAQKLQQGKTRFAMHQAMTQLPSKVRWRWSKTDVTPIVVGGMYRWHQDTLRTEALTPAPAVGELLNLAHAEQAYHRYITNPTATDGSSLWKIAMLSSWLRETRMVA